MARQKKIKIVQEEESKPEVNMSSEAVLDNLQTEVDLARSELEKTRMELEEKKKELSTMGRRDLDENEKRLVEKQVSVTNERNSANELIEKQKAYDNVKVTGKFINRRAPGQPAKLTYLKYVDDPVKWYTFEDGKIYTIPRGFADQINEYYYTPHFVQKQGEQNLSIQVGDNSSIAEVDISNKKYTFVPVAF